MESGINADQNFYSRRPLPQSPDKNQQHQRSYEPPPLPEFEARSPQLPPKLPFLTTSNLRAVATNGYGGGLTGSSGGDPDEFYREYRGVQQSSNSYTDITSNGMSATASESRLTPSSLRSNGNGTTPKHPSVSASRNALKPSYRSASSPLDDRMALGNAKSTPALNGYQKSQQPSVKDLLKRFDQNNEQSTSTARKPAPRLNTKVNDGPGYMRDRVGYQARLATNNSNGAGTSRAGVLTRDNGPGRVKSPINSRSTQRTRFATEDQHSNNTLSGVARSTRPRNPVSGNNSQFSKSMTNLSPTSPNPPSEVLNRKPLFGEVLPIGQGLPDIGYGIPRVATRRTSDSSLHPSWAHRRSRSDIDVSPSSPTAWYLGVTPALDDVDPNKPPRTSFGHNRNHSDFADNRVNTMNGVNPSFQPPMSAPASQSISRLPLASKPLSTSSSSSPPSTRASSPFKSETQSNGKLRKPDQRPWSPAGRATPTNPSTTPTRQSPRGKAKTPEKPAANNASLKAYISAPLPKTSPPLRSSRPRQPVSAATTASSRQKAADRSGSPQQVRTGMKITRNGGGEDSRPTRKLPDLGTVDFAARRALIQRAYTKSIHESEQREIRAANYRRLQEREAQRAADKAKEAGQSAAETAASVKLPPQAKPSSPEPLRVTTSFFRPDQSNGANRSAATDLDSPTLGMPGSFVDDDEPPQSALSTATGTTEIENEPQTEAARFSRMPSMKRSQPSMLANQVVNVNDLSPEQARYGMDNSQTPDNGSIQIMLDATPVEEPEPTPTKDDFTRDQSRDPSPPGAWQKSPDLGDDQPVFATTLTAASPKETSPAHSRPVTPLESSDEHGSSLPDDSYPQSRVAREISYPDEEYSGTPDSVDAPRLELPTLRSALAPSMALGDVNDYLHTPITDMDYESSDGIGHTSATEQENYDSYDQNRGIKTSPRVYRASHQSAWTDYSVETDNEASDHELYPPATVTIFTTDPEKKPTPPPKEQSPEVPPKPDNYSPQPSPLFTTDTPRLPSANRHQLPPLSTGDGFGLGLSDRSPKFSGSSAPLWPDYSPPPPPASQQPGDASPAHPSRSPPPMSFYNRRPPSSLYQPSLNGRNAESRRASDDLYSPRPSISTPRSSTQISLEDVSASQSFEEGKEVTEEDKQFADKAKKRLFMRRMVIKELIDTESVYLKDMNVVEEIYKGTAEACPKLDGNDIKAIFRNSDEVVAFSTMFLDELKSAGSSVYSPRTQRSRQSRSTTATSITTASASPAAEDRFSVAATLSDDTDEQKDSKTFIGANFGKHLKKMQSVYADFLKNGENASNRLAVLQNDGAVKVWLSECNLVAKDLTAAWDLDALLVKPVQRITRYQLLLAQLFDNTTEEHPDYQALQLAVREIAGLLKNIDDLKRRVYMVGKIVGRKRKESDVRSGLAKAFGRRAEKLQSSTANRPHDDETYIKLHEKFGDDYLRLQVVLRDVEFYTRQVTTYVNDFLRYLSAIELYMRTSASPYPELESKWARFNMSMRDMGTVALEDHVQAVRRRVIEPFEQVIQAYGPPGLAMKKRTKRRLDYEKSLVARGQGKKIDEKLKELVDQYEALNETLKIELPKLSSMTEKIGNICLVQFIAIQTEWFGIWQDKVKWVIEESQMPRDIDHIVDMFSRDYKYVQARAQELGIVNGTLLDAGNKTRQSSSSTKDDEKAKGRPSNLSSRSRGLSLNSDKSPSLPTPDFAKRHSGQFTFSPLVSTTPGLPQFAYQPYSNGHSRAGSGSPATPDTAGSRPHASSLARPSTGRSYTSDNGVPRISTDYNTQNRRESGSTYNSGGGHHIDGPIQSSRPFSGIFHSAMPVEDGPEASQRSSRASSRDRNNSGGYNVLYLAASLFEFNISATKTEAGYPYLTYQAGEIFDVIAEKGELWLAKNQDDPSDQVGWIWSKHFARLATD